MEFIHDYVALLVIIMGLTWMYMPESKKVEFCWYCKEPADKVKLNKITQKNIEHTILECELCTELLKRAFSNAKASDWQSARATANGWKQKDYSRPKKARKDERDESNEEGSEEVRT